MCYGVLSIYFPAPFCPSGGIGPPIRPLILKYWFSASSLWYTQDTSGADLRSPVKANVFMRCLHDSTSFLSTRFSDSNIPTLALRSTHPLLITG